MKHSSFAKEFHADTRSFSFRHFCTDVSEKRFNIRPFNIRTHRTSKDKLYCLAGFAFHEKFGP